MQQLFILGLRQRALFHSSRQAAALVVFGPEQVLVEPRHQQGGRSAVDPQGGAAAKAGRVSVTVAVRLAVNLG